MSTAKGMLSNLNYLETLEKALNSPKGLRLTFNTAGEAETAKVRFNTARIQQRKKNRETYPENHPLHNASEFDGITIRRDKDNKCILYLESQAAILAKANIEEIE